MAALDQIRTIVVVIMENRSFDHVLGYLSLPQYGGRRDVDGLVNLDTDPRFASEYDQQIYRPFPMADGRLLHDLPHGRREVAIQLAVSGATPTMSGFVRAYVEASHSIVEQPPPLGYLTPDSVFMSDFLARNYLVCDRWFAPLPTDTHPNRVMAFTGTATVDETKSDHSPPQSGLRLADETWGALAGLSLRVFVIPVVRRVRPQPGRQLPQHEAACERHRHRRR